MNLPTTASDPWKPPVRSFLVACAVAVGSLGAAGTIDLQFDTRTSSIKSSTLSTRNSRVNTGRFVDCFFELPYVLFNKRQTGSSDFRIISGTTTGAKVPVQRIAFSDTPFADPDFQMAVSRCDQTEVS